MITKEEVDAILAAHAAWKTRFRDFLVGKPGMDVAALGDVHQCAFGAWLDKYGSRQLAPDQFEAIGALHSEFHRIAADVVARLRARDFEGARIAIAPGGTLEQASGALAARLLAVKDQP